MFQQTCSIAMGSLLYLVVGYTFTGALKTFEIVALKCSTIKPKIKFHYDNTIDLFLDHLNEKHPDIKFTFKLKSNNSLPFLDMLVSCPLHGRLGHSVYRISTHSDGYLNPSQKLSGIISLIYRTITLSEPYNFQIEIKKVSESLQSNGYRKEEIAGTMKRPQNPCPKPKNNDSHR